MHRRFAEARRTEIACPAGAVNVVVAESFGLRLLGLMRLGAEEIQPLLFPRCRAVHTFGMRAAIDLVWLEGELGHPRVLRVVERLGPRRTARAPGARFRRKIAALELPEGQAARLGFPTSASPPNP